MDNGRNNESHKDDDEVSRRNIEEALAAKVNFKAYLDKYELTDTIRNILSEMFESDEWPEDPMQYIRFRIMELALLRLKRKSLRIAVELYWLEVKVGLKSLKKVPQKEEAKVVSKGNNMLTSYKK